MGSLDPIPPLTLFVWINGIFHLEPCLYGSSPRLILNTRREVHNDPPRLTFQITALPLVHEHLGQHIKGK